MFGGNPEQLKQMMQQMGIDFEEINAEEIVIKTIDGEELQFDDATVNRLTGQGQEVYQIMGEPVVAESGSTSEEDSTEQEAEEQTEESPSMEITEDDVEIVALRAGVTEDEAREVLEETHDLAEAIERLED